MKKYCQVRNGFIQDSFSMALLKEKIIKMKVVKIFERKSNLVPFIQIYIGELNLHFTFDFLRYKNQNHQPFMQKETKKFLSPQADQISKIQNNKLYYINNCIYLLYLFMNYILEISNGQKVSIYQLFMNYTQKCLFFILLYFYTFSKAVKKFSLPIF
ncbi:hypothetical protein pb186bvf_014688 [Paramecium bursaria]